MEGHFIKVIINLLSLYYERSMIKSNTQYCQKNEIF